jgi:hypothetical protein
MKRLALCITLSLTPILAGAARQETPAPAANTTEVRAVRVSTPPVIDGDLTDEAWKSAPEITRLIQREPDENHPPSERSVVRIVYDDHAIYFAAELFDSHPVTAVVARRDQSVFTDSFTVNLDPHHDHRSGAGFSVSSANVQTDFVLYNDTSSDNDWDAVWASATKITSEGWNVEMRIPFSQLRFPDRDVHVWGINIRRFIARRHETILLASAPRNEPLGVSLYAHLTGIEGIRRHRTVELMPYAVARADIRGTVAAADPLNSATGTNIDVGLDVRYPIASNLTLSGTLNPDFGQVEVDPAVVNLSQFETFYPEKRPFFLEGATLFDFGRGGSNSGFGFNFSTPDFFYSRRIGRSPQLASGIPHDWIDSPTETTIAGAAKITGKTAGGWTVAVMDAVTTKESATVVLDGERRSLTAEPLTNYLVSRFARDLGNRGRVGTLFTAVNRDLDARSALHLRSDAYAAGTDGYWAFGNRDVILEWGVGGTLVEGSPEAIAATQRSPARYYNRPDAGHVEYDPTRTSLAGWGARTMLAKQTGKWRYNVSAQSFSPGFETNDVGFMNRTDTTATHAVVLYSEAVTTPLLRRKNFWLGKYQNWNFDGDLIANGAYGSAFLLFANYWDVSCSGGYGAESWDDRLTRGGPLTRRPAGYSGNCRGSTDSRRPLYVSFAGGGGRSDAGASDEWGMIGLRYRPRDNVTFSVEPEIARSTSRAQYVRAVADTAAPTWGRRYVFADLDQRAVEISMRLDWTFSSALTMQVYVQPFVASGAYTNLKELARPRSYEFDVYGVDRGSVSLDPARETYTIDPDGAGPSAAFQLRNPDFTLRSLRGSAVMRWEFRPGSSLYVVWNENRAGVVRRGDLDFARDLRGIGDTDSDDVFLVKIGYWLPL